MAREIAIPASIAADLAQAASVAISEQNEKNREYTAEELSKAASTLIKAYHNADNKGQFVAVPSRYVSKAAAFDRTEDRAGANGARPFLYNTRTWTED